MAIKSTADKVATIQKGYTLDGPTIELGAAIVDGEHRAAEPAGQCRRETVPLPPISSPPETTRPLPAFAPHATGASSMASALSVFEGDQNLSFQERALSVVIGSVQGL